MLRMRWHLRTLRQHFQFFKPSCESKTQIRRNGENLRETAERNSFQLSAVSSQLCFKSFAFLGNTYDLIVGYFGLEVQNGR